MAVAHQPAPTVTDLGAATAAPTGRSRVWRRLREDRVAMAGLVVLGALVLLALLADVIANGVIGHGPNDLYAEEMTDDFGLPRGPTGEFLFGADQAGRDVLVRVLYGIRTALLVGVVATAIGTALGLVCGMLAGYFGGIVDTVLSRLADIALAMPLLLLAIGLYSSCGTSPQGCLGGALRPGLPLLIAIIALATWPYVTRVVRGQTLGLREREFIEASRALGAGHLRILRRDVLPNLIAPVVVYATLLVPVNIILEASLSFLGVGVPQSTPSWGRMLADATPLIEVAWWLTVFPGLFLVATTLALNLLGDGLRDAIDPREER